MAKEETPEETPRTFTEEEVAKILEAKERESSMTDEEKRARSIIGEVVEEKFQAFLDRVVGDDGSTPGDDQEPGGEAKSKGLFDAFLKG